MFEDLEIEIHVPDEPIPEFPMVVFLRGDEPYFNEFCLSADKVMEVLGIRRSRLNQISGKELRVGRARIDNYIRPVYRKIDVEEYLKWIRPSVTHKKSSDVLNEARSKLEEQTERVSEEISLQFESMMSTFQKVLKSQNFEQKISNRTLFLKLQKNLNFVMNSLLRKNTFLQSRSVLQHADIKYILEYLPVLQKDLEHMKIAVTDIREKVSYCERMLLDVQGLQKAQQNFLESFALSFEEWKMEKEEGSQMLPRERYRKGFGAYSRIRQNSTQVSFDSTRKKMPSWKRKKYKV